MKPIAPINSFMLVTKCMNLLMETNFLGSFSLRYSSYLLVSGKFTLNLPVINMDIDGLKNISYPILPDVIVIDVDSFPLSYYIETFYWSGFFNVKATHFFVGKNIPSNMSVVLSNYFISKALLIDLHTGIISKHVRHLRTKNFVNMGICPGFKKTRLSQNIIKYSGNDRIESWYGRRMVLCHPINFNYSDERVEKRLFDIIWDHFKIEVNSKVIYLNDTVIRNNTCDIFFGNVQAESQHAFEITDPYIYDHLSWFVPTEIVSVGLYPIKIFTISSWLFWLITALSICTVWFAIDILLLEHRGIIMFFEKTTQIALLFLEQSRKYRMTFTSELLIIVLVVYFAFNMTAHYKSKLIYVLSDRRYDENIQTFNDIWKHGLKMSIPQEDMPINLPERFENILKKHHIKNCGTTEECWNKLIENGNMAILISDLDGKYLEIQDFRNKRGKWIRKLTPPYFAIRISAFFFKGHPFLPIFNKYLGFLMKFGFVDMQQEENAYKHDVSREPVKLSFFHLKGPFIFWIIGIALGASAFTFEYI